MPLCHTLPSRRQAMQQDIKNSFSFTILPLSIHSTFAFTCIVFSFPFHYHKVLKMLVFGLMVPVSNPVFAITPIFWMKPQLSASYSNIVRVQWCIYVLQPLHLPWVFTVVLLNQLGVCYGLICMATSNNYCRSIHCLCWFQTFSAI